MLLLLVFLTPDDQNTFEVLYTSCKSLMLNKAYGILRDRALAEDAVSEAFIRVYKNIGKIGDPASGRSLAFVMTIVKNVALTMLEQRSRYRADDLDDDQADPVSLEEEVLSKLSSDRIYELLNRVNEAYRDVFVLKYAYEMSHREIGRALHITENNVTVRLYRAKKQIAVILQGEGFHD